jgi:hypothetical protein
MRPERRAWSVRGPATALVAVAALGLGGRRAEAQFGYGWGMWGAMNAGGGQANMATLNYVNQRASQAAAYAYSSRASIGGGNVYAGNPNSYINHVRDNSNDRFFDRYDVSTRRVSGPPPATLAALAGPPAESPGGDIPPPPDPSGRTRPSDSGTNPPQRPRAPALVSFFTAAGKLGWPAEAPTAGDLESKRDAVDQSVQSVQDQVKVNGQASVRIVSLARSRLLDYGRPALAYTRQHTTPAVADTFHNFLLALYDALGNAAAPPSPGSGR